MVTSTTATNTPTTSAVNSITDGDKAPKNVKKAEEETNRSWFDFEGDLIALRKRRQLALPATEW